jgi:hypothetical protein
MTEAFLSSKRELRANFSFGLLGRRPGGFCLLELI